MSNEQLASMAWTPKRSAPRSRRRRSASKSRVSSAFESGDDQVPETRSAGSFRGEERLFRLIVFRGNAQFFVQDVIFRIRLQLRIAPVFELFRRFFCHIDL